MSSQLFPETKTSCVKDSTSGGYLDSAIGINGQTLVSKGDINATKIFASNVSRNLWYNVNGTTTLEASPAEVEAALQGAPLASGEVQNTVLHSDADVINQTLDLTRDSKLVTTGSLININTIDQQSLATWINIITPKEASLLVAEEGNDYMFDEGQHYIVVDDSSGNRYLTIDPEEISSLYVVFKGISHNEIIINFKGSTSIDFLECSAIVNNEEVSYSYKLFGSIPEFDEEADYCLVIKDNNVVFGEQE